MIKMLRNGIAKVLKWFGIFVIAVLGISLVYYALESPEERAQQKAEREAEEASKQSIADAEAKRAEKEDRKAAKEKIKEVKRTQSIYEAEDQARVDATSATDLLNTQDVTVGESVPVEGNQYLTEVTVTMGVCIECVITNIHFGVCAWDENGNPLLTNTYANEDYYAKDNVEAFVADYGISVEKPQPNFKGYTYTQTFGLYTKKPVATAKAHVSYITRGYIDISNGNLEDKYENIQAEAYTAWVNVLAGGKLKI